MRVKLSIALVTRNRPTSLKRALQSIRQQEVQPWEVIVSDDSDEEDARARTRELAASYNCRYVQGPQNGLYPNRNRAARACEGTHIRTMDDDHELPGGHIASCMRALRSDPEAVWVIGEKNYSTGLEGDEIARPGELHPKGHTVVPDDIHSSEAIADGSTIFPRSVFTEEGGYKEKPWFGYLYLELGARLRARGYRIREVEDTHIVHHDKQREDKFSHKEDYRGEDARYYAMMMKAFSHDRNFYNMCICATSIAYDIFIDYRKSKYLIRSMSEFWKDI